MQAIHDFIVEVLLFPSLMKFFAGMEQAQEILQTDMIAELSHYISAVQGIVKGICSGIMAVFVGLEFLDIIKKEDLDLNRFIFLFIKIGICRLLVFCAPDLLELIVLTGNYWCAGLAGESLDTSTFEGTMHTLLSMSIPSESGEGPMGFIAAFGKLILAFIGAFINMLIWIVAWIMMIVLSYTRNVELVVLTALSPIPLCFIPWEGSKEITKRFIFSYAAVVLTGFIMIMMMEIYIDLILAGEMDIMWITAMDVLLVVLFAKAGGWAKEALGQG